MKPVSGILAAILIAAALAGCKSTDSTRPLMQPDRLSAANYRATGVPARLGDTDPHGWAGTVPARYPVHGIDAARYQGLIDFRTAARAGIGFAWIKATEGGDFLDPGFRQNYARARAAGVPVGGYHFYYFCRSAAEQADWFIANVPRAKGDLPPVLDIEWNHTSPSCRKRPAPHIVQAEMRVFLEKLTAAYGTRPVIYTTPDFWRDNGLEGFGGYDLWLRSVTAHPSERYTGTHWEFWQWTGTGVVPGVRGISDVNAYRGSASDWEAWKAARLQ